MKTSEEENVQKVAHDHGTRSKRDPLSSGINYGAGPDDQQLEVVVESIDIGRTCSQCREAKVKCDKKQPCMRCILRGLVCVAQLRGPGRPCNPKKELATEGAVTKETGKRKTRTVKRFTTGKRAPAKRAKKTKLDLYQQPPMQPPAHVMQHPPAHVMQQPPAHGMQQPPAHGMQQPPAHGMQQPPAHGMQQPPAHGMQQPPAHGMQQVRTPSDCLCRAYRVCSDNLTRRKLIKSLKMSYYYKQTHAKFSGFNGELNGMGPMPDMLSSSYLMRQQQQSRQRQQQQQLLLLAQQQYQFNQRQHIFNPDGSSNTEIIASLCNQQTQLLKLINESLPEERGQLMKIMAANAPILNQYFLSVPNAIPSLDAPNVDPALESPESGPNRHYENNNCFDKYMTQIR